MPDETPAVPPNTPPVPPPPGTGTFSVRWEGDVPPNVTVAPPQTRFTKYASYATFAVSMVIFIVGTVAYVAGHSQTPPGPPPVFPTADELQLASVDPDAPIQTYGWIEDQLAVQAVIGQEEIPVFGDTPAGKTNVVQGDGDVFLWDAVRKCLPPGSPYPNVNQRDVGCCVGTGFKHGVDILQSVQITQGTAAEFRPAAVEPIYGGSRVEVGGGRISGDGSIGAWAAKWVKAYGVLPMRKYPETGTPVVADLTQFSPAKARQWGRSGVPDSLEPLAREYPVKGVALVRSWEECKKAIAQGYPIPVCSNQGFRMQRDANGFASPQGSWAHCMLICGVRGGNRPGAFVLNSWGDQAHTGGVYPADMPKAGFWADASVIDRMLAQGDSYALSDVTGFPSRKLDWSFAQAAPKPATVNPVAAFAAGPSH